jgi:hypothetical protein
MRELHREEGKVTAREMREWEGCGMRDYREE